MNVLVSACLLGENCKYNGKNNYNKKVAAYCGNLSCNGDNKDNKIIKVCPEVLGGLSVPRTPGEIVQGKVKTRDGVSLHAEFAAGAQKALAVARSEGVDLAILQSRSPSCGIKQIYDGSFTGKLIPGMGIFASLLHKEGIPLMAAEDME